jgi:phosphohistidine phosphatase SixA
LPEAVDLPRRDVVVVDEQLGEAVLVLVVGHAPLLDDAVLHLVGRGKPLLHDDAAEDRVEARLHEGGLIQLVPRLRGRIAQGILIRLPSLVRHGQFRSFRLADPPRVLQARPALRWCQ